MRPMKYIWIMLMAVALLVAAGCADADPDEPADVDPADEDAAEPDDPVVDDDAEPDPEPDVDDRETVTLRTVTAFDRNAAEHIGFWMFVERLEERAPWIEIDYRGGPEVIEGFDQIEAASDGAIDMINIPDSYVPQVMPLADAMKLSPLTPTEEREQSVYEFWQEAFASNLNVMFLGKSMANAPYQLFLNDPIETADLSGLNIRVSPAQAPAVRAVGGSVVTMPGGEIYTAIERGVIDGFGWASVGVTALGLQEVVNYQLYPTFFQVNMGIILNLDMWESLDEETQTALQEVMEEIEGEVVDRYTQVEEDERSEREAAGVEILELPPDEAERFLDAAYDQAWEEVIDAAPESAELRDTFGN